MNKKLKIASAAVAVVMAGTMAFGMFGCGGNDDSGTPTPTPTPTPSATVKVDEAGKLTWDANTQINASIGYNSNSTGMKIKPAATVNGKTESGSPLLDKDFMGKTWSDGDLKPAWQAVQDKLNIRFNDLWSYVKSTGESSANLTNVKDNLGFKNIDVFTASLTKVNEEAVKNGSLLNLTDYLDYMPNYKKFLESDVIRMSLMASADGDMYVAPYFDGNDDIEKFVLIRKDLVERMLDKALPATTGEGAKTDGTFTGSTYVEAYMGSTNYTIATTKPASLSTATGEQKGAPRYGNDAITVTNNDTVDVTVNYTAALAAAKERTSNDGDGSALYQALKEAKRTLDVMTLTSGNIIDLMNAVLAENEGVTGTQLLNILRAYIDVAYTVNGQPLYVEANGLTRASVFNSACAAWDVDLYVALGRCYKASGNMFDNVDVNTAANGKPKFLVSGRSNTDQRQTDLYSLVGELYGVRGLESRYNYSYIDGEGNLKDTRKETKTWDALNAFAQVAKEGLVNIGTDAQSNGLAGGDYGGQTNYETLSLHDYSQTQTKVGFNALADKDNMNMAPIVTPVSKWSVDGTETIMRFTESWRSVKTEGLAVSANVASNPNKLSAVLALIDYIYSPDGQIVMTYGPQSTNGNTNPNGTWYADKVTDKTADEVANKITDATNYIPAQYEMKAEYKNDYFVYNGEVYVGTFYNGRRIPTMTDENKTLFQNTSNNFTNHARQNLGTCFPVGNKDQGFEYQCTANSGLDGSDIVNICLNNGTIKHQSQTVDKDNLWYMLVPTNLPYTKAQTTALGAGNLAFVSGLGSSSTSWYTKGSSDKGMNLMLRLMQNGYKNGVEITINGEKADITSAQTIITSHKALDNFITLSDGAFQLLMDWYDGQNS